jgi:hypothetical protein
MGLGQLGDFPMKKYSIVRIGSEYIVQVGETSILRVSSRREADKLVTDAAELLQQELTPQVDQHPSIERDARVIPAKVP